MKWKLGVGWGSQVLWKDNSCYSETFNLNMDASHLNSLVVIFHCSTMASVRADHVWGGGGHYSLSCFFFLLTIVHAYMYSKLVCIVHYFNVNYPYPVFERF